MTNEEKAKRLEDMALIPYSIQKKALGLTNTAKMLQHGRYTKL